MGGTSSSEDHGHSHGEHGHCHGEHNSHGHAHDSHGHSHESHGHSHDSHGHSHESHGHSHGSAACNDDHGHSHGAEPCDAEHGCADSCTDGCKSKSGHDLTPFTEAQRNEAAKKLSDQERSVCFQSGTERPFTGRYWDSKAEGTYECVVCGLPLFASSTKFNSGTGWPSFYDAYDPAHVCQRTDRSAGMVRNEDRCARCGAHLGHVFDDGPAPTGLRHCINSASLKFVPKSAASEAASPAPSAATTTAAASAPTASE